VVQNRQRFPANFNQSMQAPGGYTDQVLNVAAARGTDVLYSLPSFDGGPSAFAPHRRAKVALVTNDTIHPNEAGQVALAELALRKFGFSPVEQPGVEETVSFVAEADTHIDIRSPNTNFGTNTQLGLGADAAARVMYLRFNVSGLPAGATITDASLRMRASNGGGGGAIRRVAPVNPQWSETQPTWNAPLQGSVATGDLAVLGQVLQGQDAQYPGLAGAIVGNGRVTFMIRSGDLDGSAFHSSEHPTASTRPTLSVTYSVGGSQLLPPVANAGVDQTVVDGDNSGIERVVLNGTGSLDPDGTIVSYEWTKGGVPIAVGVTPSVDLAVGVHTIVLTAEDDDGQTATDTVQVTVSPFLAVEQTVAFVAEVDTHIDIRSPNTNFGTSTQLGLGGDAAARVIYLRFNVSGLPAGATITDASLRMRVSNGGGGGTIRRFAPMNPQWSETQPTWNAPLGGSDASGNLAVLGQVLQGQDAEYPGLANAIVGNGRVSFVIRSGDLDGSAFHSSEHGTASSRPILSVTYSGSGG
jgi:hypothetical protein